MARLALLESVRGRASMITPTVPPTISALFGEGHGFARGVAADREFALGPQNDGRRLAALEGDDLDRARQDAELRHLAVVEVDLASAGDLAQAGRAADDIALPRCVSASYSKRLEASAGSIVPTTPAAAIRPSGSRARSTTPLFGTTSTNRATPALPRQVGSSAQRRVRQ